MIVTLRWRRVSRNLDRIATAQSAEHLGDVSAPLAELGRDASADPTLGRPPLPREIFLSDHVKLPTLFAGRERVISTSSKERCTEIRTESVPGTTVALVACEAQRSIADSTR
jgi:hypothetical protein